MSKANFYRSDHNKKIQKLKGRPKARSMRDRIEKKYQYELRKVNAEIRALEHEVKYYQNYLNNI